MTPEVARALAHDLTIDITTTGRRSGRPARVEIWFLEIAGRYFITGTPGRRDWLANLVADPRLVIHLKESAVADVPARATVVSDEAIRRLVLTHPKAAWYRGQVTLDELLRAAPMVELTIDDT